MTAATTIFNDGITAIDTEYARSLQDASHLIVEGGRAAFIDTGVNSSVPLLLDALRQRDLDVGDVDYVILTHVHLDTPAVRASYCKSCRTRVASCTVTVRRT